MAKAIRSRRMGNWYDATIKSDANGYTSNLLKHRLTTRLRRSPKQSWFLQGVCPWCGTDDLHGHRGWEAVLLRKRLVVVLLQQQWSGEARGEAVELMAILETSIGLSRQSRVRRQHPKKSNHERIRLSPAVSAK